VVPSLRASEECIMSRLAVAARCRRSRPSAFRAPTGWHPERGALPLHPMRGKDRSDAVVSPSRSFVPGSRRARALELVRRSAGSAGANASVVTRRRPDV
jgi:hypothetical protein